MRYINGLTIIIICVINAVPLTPNRLEPSKLMVQADRMLWL